MYDNPRFMRWFNAQQFFVEIEMFMFIPLNYLSKLDSQLVAEDSIYLNLPEAQRNSEAEVIKLNDRMGLSYLWILGAYEFMRTVHQRLKGDSLEADAQRVKQRLNRLRVPLAKMEAARRHPGDSHIAQPALNMVDGVAWRLTSDEFITRKEVSDEVLRFIERFAEDRRAKMIAKRNAEGW